MWRRAPGSSARSSTSLRTWGAARWWVVAAAKRSIRRWWASTPSRRRERGSGPAPCWGSERGPPTSATRRCRRASACATAWRRPRRDDPVVSAGRYALVLAGGLGTRLCLLSERRAKPAVPFAGKYRIIDFTLSNCVNSGIFDVGILTQYRPTSLHRHIGIGRPWDLDRLRGGVQLLQPSLGSVEGEWYQGTADAIRRNLLHLRRRQAEHVLVLSGDHVYKMDYNVLYAFHKASGAAVTVAVTEVAEEAVSSFG